MSCRFSSVSFPPNFSVRSTFLTLVIDRKLEQKVAETSWVHRIFGGQLRSRVTCHVCGHHSDTFDSILDLSIDVYNMPSLKDALKKFTAKDYLKGADKYKCEK